MRNFGVGGWSFYGMAGWRDKPTAAHCNVAGFGAEHEVKRTPVVQCAAKHLYRPMQSNQLVYYCGKDASLRSA